jgi:hypothetical protein
MPLRAVHIQAQGGQAQAAVAQPCRAFAESVICVEVFTMKPLYRDHLAGQRNKAKIYFCSQNQGKAGFIPDLSLFPTGLPDPRYPSRSGRLRRVFALACSSRHFATCA